MRHHGGQRFWSALATAALVASAITITAPAAVQAAETPAPTATSAALPETVSADALPTVQIDGVAWDQAVVGNTVYVGGQFTNARPAGAAAGVNQTPRANMLAYNIETGALISSFAPTFNGAVNRLAATPDGSKLVAVGAFTEVNGVQRNRVAVFDLPSGTLNNSVAAGANSAVQSVAVTNSTMYIGGYFGSVNASVRNRIAAISLVNGAVLPFTVPVDNGIVQAIVVSPDASKVVLGGSFTSVGGSNNPGYGLAQVDAATGAPLPLPVNGEVRNGGTESAILSLASDGTNFYGTGYHFGGGGNSEGTFSASWSGGSLTWLEDCHGDTYDVAPVGDVVYTASHKHYCGNSGGFPQTEPWSFYHSNAWSKSVQGVNTRDIYGYPDHPGTPRPELLNWFPQTEVGSFTGKWQATWTVEGNAKYVVYGGEFPKVNGVGQQGLVRYAVRSQAPNKQGPKLGGSATAPTVKSVLPGQVRVTWPANYDLDDSKLTYELYRDTNTNKVYQTSQSGRFWEGKPMSFTDTGLTPGTSVRYAVRAIDPSGNLVNSTWVTGTVSSQDSLGEYGRAVYADGANKFWRLGEASGSTAVGDFAGSDDTTAGSGVGRGGEGALTNSGNTSSTFNGTNAGVVVSKQQIPGPDTFSQEVWFKTTSSSGKIAGFGSGAKGDSIDLDRHLYMTGGRVYFGVYAGAQRLVSSGTGLNDGRWHQVVATLGPDGMVLYVDGKRVASRADTTSGHVYTGYWRLGGDKTWAGNKYFNGSIDEYSVYPTVLSARQVNAHWVASGRTSALPTAPADALGKAMFDSNPDSYWRLGESSGTTAADSAFGANTATFTGNYTRNQPGVVSGNGSLQLKAPVKAGTTTTTAGGNATGKTAVVNPTTFSQEVWLKTSTSQGGRIFGFGSSSNGSLSSSYDRALYMLDDGKVRFGIGDDATRTIDSTRSLNDNKWHQVVTAVDSTGMKLYVDGVLQSSSPNNVALNYTGYWKLGGDNTLGGHASQYFAGYVDEAAVYPRALTSAEVRGHFAAGGGAIPNESPTAAFTSKVTDLNASFDASGSSDADGTVASYAWDFGDSKSGSGATPAHSYEASGTYAVKLTVTDDKGATSTVTRDVTVLAANVKPTASFTSGTTDLKASFDASGSTDSDGTVRSYDWDFGDGTSGAGIAAEHTYAAAGTYRVKLTVTDNRGGTGLLTRDVTVRGPNVKPTARFESVVAGLKASFDGAGSTDSDGSVASYAWDFGDTTSGTGVKAEHTYAAAGTYTVKLTVTDNRGATDSVERQVTVTAPPPPVAGAIASDNFARMVTGGWGTADIGGPWTLRGVASRYNVNGGAATWVVPKSTFQYANLNSVSSQSARTTIEFSLDKVVPGQFIGLVGRQVGSEYFAARLDPEAGGAARLHLLRTDAAMGGAGVVIPGLTLVAGQKYKFSLEVRGVNPTTISAKVWKSSEPEPAGWQRTTTQTFAALQAPGGVGLFGYLAGTATDSPVTVTYHNFTTVEPQ